MVFYIFGMGQNKQSIKSNLHFMEILTDCYYLAYNKKKLIKAIPEAYNNSWSLGIPLWQAVQQGIIFGVKET